MLETAIQENTAALRDMQALFAKFMASTPLPPAAKVESPKPVKAEKATTVAQSVEAPVETAQEPMTAASPSEVTYADVSAAVLAKMKTDKAVVMAAASKFGVKNAKELKPEQWADFIKAIA